jgi:Ca2+-binding RTX toxin-like protein
MSTLGASRRLHFSIAVATAAAGLVALGPPAAADGETCNGVAATIVGAGDIAGTADKDVIVGSSGDDVIDAGAGDDIICAGDGNDEVSDGLGKDKVYLEGGDDTAIAYVFKDIQDVFDGGTGTDTADYSLRTTGVKLSLNAGADDGQEAEFDRLPAMENLIGGSNNDTLLGSNGNNVLDGGDGNDTISDLAGADTVFGGQGDDTVTQGITKDVGDTLDGGDGVDLISYAARPAAAFGGVVIDLDSTNGTSGQPQESDALSAFENARGGQAPDAIVGTDGPNVIQAGNGANTVEGLGGDDTITTGTAIDLVYDGPGADLVTTGGECDRVVQDDYSTDNIQASGGSCDVVDYSQRIENLTINIGSPNAINGAAGEADVLRGFENAYGGAGDDAISGSGGPNLLVGGNGADTVAGVGGNDAINVHDGVGGNDTANGGFGVDTGEIDAGDTAIAIETVTVY